MELMKSIFILTSLVIGEIVQGTEKTRQVTENLKLQIVSQTLDNMQSFVLIATDEPKKKNQKNDWSTLERTKLNYRSLVINSQKSLS